jgi:hypothetical protein
MNLGATAPELEDMSAEQRDEAIGRFQAAAKPVIARFADGAGLVHPASANVAMARA